MDRSINRFILNFSVQENPLSFVFSLAQVCKAQKAYRISSDMERLRLGFLKTNIYWKLFTVSLSVKSWLGLLYTRTARHIYTDVDCRQRQSPTAGDGNFFKKVNDFFFLIPSYKMVTVLKKGPSCSLVFFEPTVNVFLFFVDSTSSPADGVVGNPCI